MTDREMLELAAKAIGYVVEEYTNNGWAWVYPKDAAPDEDGEMPIFKWAPSDDDGDSRRLEVKLCMEVSCNDGVIGVSYPVGENRELHELIEVIELDRYAATRLAVLRAAAAIGEAMP